jgi:UDP-glucose 4-epimerase
MKFLVTGGAGYIGSACVEELINQGHSLTVFDNLSEGHRSAVHPEAEFVMGCLSQPHEVKTAISRFSPEVVIHFAASALVGESMQDPGKYFTNNVTNGIHLLDACVEANVRKIVFSSTCATYGVPSEIPLTEETTQEPINPYGESKLMFEKILQWYHQIHGLDFVAFRYFNACGATPLFGEHHRVETHLIPNILKVVLGQRELCSIFGTDYPTPDGTCVRDYIHIQDLAKAHITAAQTDTVGFFNLGTGMGYSVREVISACETVTNSRIKVVEQVRRDGDPPELVAAPAKVMEALDWKPEYTEIDKIVESAWVWHQKHPQGYGD